MGMRGRASGQATSLSTEHPVTNSFTFSVIQHPPDAERARLRVEQILNPYPAHYRLAFAFSGVLCRQTHWRPLRLAVSGNQRGLPVYHVSYQHRYGWVRFRLFAGDATSATGDFIAPVPDPLPFWFKPVSIFGLLRVTTFNSGSHMLTIPPHPCSQPP